MKKLLISILIVLLVILAYFTMFKGMSLGSLQILGISQIVDLNDSLTNTIQKTNSLLKKEYPSKQEELSDSVTELLEKKEEYSLFFMCINIFFISIVVAVSPINIFSKITQ